MTEPGALCRSHLRQRRHLGLELEAFLVDARVTPLARWGQCQVGACPRDRATSGPYCGPHRERLRKHRRLDPGLDEQRWRRTEPAVSEDNAVCLLGLADQVVTELLYGLQHRTENGTKTSFRIFRGLAVRLLRLGAIRTSDLPDVGLDTATRAVRNLVVTAVADRDCDPLTCWDSDRWSLNSVGHAGAVRFDRITQNWLREAAKHWVFAELPKARSRTAATRMQTHVNAIVRLSASLVRHRDDHGRDLHRLGRHDVVEFLNWMGHLQATGRITRTTRHRECTHIAFVLRRMRSGGLTRPAGPLHGLADDFALEPDDMPAHHRDPASRDLPPEVVTALIDTLPALEAATSTEFRVAVELLMDTGRRPGEIVALRLECLDHDTDDKPVLLWDNYKTGRYGRRLPIPEATATIIATQQARVRARFPRTPASELVLLPSPLKNHDGRRPITIYYLRDNHRRWANSLPELPALAAEIVDGHTRTRALPFPRERIQPYSWRHTYAQRHADAGIAVDVLCELMDHTSMATTQGYYRVSETRRRDAVDRVTALQFDRHGHRTWHHASALLESERARRAVGEVAVPYGICTEPTNVAAGGDDCPVRFRCVGCDHFRTDASYLPDLEAYLADLLRNRERLACLTSADSWAISEATPSDAEITRIRALISQITHQLGDLGEREQAALRDAVTVVRRARGATVGLGMPTIRHSQTSLAGISHGD
nr:tyrosine-type recombinase/integrase [Pseudonocardia alni]